MSFSSRSAAPGAILFGGKFLYGFAQSFLFRCQNEIHNSSYSFFSFSCRIRRPESQPDSRCQAPDNVPSIQLLRVAALLAGVALQAAYRKMKSLLFNWGSRFLNSILWDIHDLLGLFKVLFPLGERFDNQFGAVRGSAAMHATGDTAAHGQPLDQTSHLGAAFAVATGRQGLLDKCAIVCLHILPGRHATGFGDAAADVLSHDFGLIRQLGYLGLVDMRQQCIRHEHSGFHRLAEHHGAQADAGGNFIVDRHFVQGRLEGFDRQSIGAGHAHRGADHDIALACYAVADSRAIDRGEVADVPSAVFELAAHEHALVRNEDVVEMDVGLGDVAGMRHIVAFFSGAGCR